MDLEQTQAAQPVLNGPKFEIEQAQNGRDFGRVSIHPNGEEWLITECSQALNPKGACYILKFNKRTQQLYRYDFPSGYDYSFASFSPKGNWIIASRFPENDHSDEQLRRALLQGEIVMMRPDGSDFQVLPIPKGRNLIPVMSPSETKIAYWRSDLHRPAGSRNQLSHFDLYEYDLSTQKNGLFAGAFNLFEGGNLQYLSENELIFSSFGPIEVSLSEYHKKFNGSEVYRLMRNAVTLSEPSYVNIKNVKDSSSDQEGNIYLTGEIPAQGTSFIKTTPSGTTSSWRAPGNMLVSGLRHLIISADGKYFCFVYVAEGARPREGKQAIGVFDLHNDQWIPIKIPTLQSSVAIPTKTFTQ